MASRIDDPTVPEIETGDIDLPPDDGDEGDDE
jgi:hypothetical protein